ncbi:MAG: hypothetical protein ABFD51_13290 [Anaerolineaceae bacterium]|nr:hypothetical protein [Betaproteobacteria bacterium]
MANVLKGNYTLNNPVVIEQDKDVTPEQLFEKEALKRLGGSIAFVAKQKVMWDTPEEKENK